MVNSLFRKGLVVGIIVLFIGVALAPNILAFNLSEQLSNQHDSNSELSDCETCNNGCDMELVKIIPHYFRDIVLYFGCKIKNVGENTCYGGIGFEIKAYLWRTNILITTDSYIFDGELHKGEERNFAYSQHGVRFEGTYFPRFYRLKFRAYPDDSNMENNYLEAIYMVWGIHDFNQNYMEIKTYRPSYVTSDI